MDHDIIRTARPGDAGQLLTIYAPYVRETAITFEYEVPSEEEFRRRIARTLEKYPYLTAERDGTLLGYAYAGPFKERAAYGWSAEVSIYVAQSARRQGIGRRLYNALERILREMKVLNLNACIGYPIGEDPFLTDDSVQFHRRMGYRWIGEFHRCGYKFGRWYDMVWMEKLLDNHPDQPEAVIPFRELEMRKSSGHSQPEQMEEAEA